jgi:hypothetical protein
MSHLPQLLCVSRPSKACPLTCRYFLMRPQLLTRVSAFFWRGKDDPGDPSKGGGVTTWSAWLETGRSKCLGVSILNGSESP